MSKKFKIYPSIGIARLGDSEAKADDVVFSPEIPWANLYETENNYITPDGKLKKQAQKFYIYECDEKGNPVGPADLSDYDVEWTVEVANKKAFWYDFNNSLDLSVQLHNHNNLSPIFFNRAIAPGIDASYRNPNVLNQEQRQKNGVNYRKELVNSPGPVSVGADEKKKEIKGTFPFNPTGHSQVAAVLNAKAQPVNLGTLEYDDGNLIFYGADGISAALNPSDLNTDFADNSNWYDDICDGRVTAKLTPKKDKHHDNEVKPIYLDDAESAAWIATAPPDYAPQIQPISTMFDLIMGAADEDEQEYGTDFSMVFPLMYRLYRMQWVNLGDFLSPSFREAIDRLIKDGKFHYLFLHDTSSEAYNVRNSIFMMFRNPHYDYTNEPIIPSKEKTDLINLGSGNEDLKLPYYPGDGINYPGSPAQWFAIPPLLYDHLRRWRDGEFKGLDPKFKGEFSDMDKIGHHYRHQFMDAAKDPAKRPLLMTRAVLETLYGGGFHPGVELTWPLRHKQLYKENRLPYAWVTEEANLFGLREVRVNAATRERQKEIFYNDFGLQINADDIKESLEKDNEKNWFWEMTPGDFTKWMGIPWQSDAGSCQAVFTDSQYPVPAWWAANLPVDVLTEESLAKIQDRSVLEDTKLSIYANRLPWLQTTDTGFVGYHAEGGYMNGLINMVYQWKKIGVVTGRKSHAKVKGIPETVYVSFDTKNKKTKPAVFLGKSIANRPVTAPAPSEFYANSRETIWIPEDKDLILSSKPDGTGDIVVDDQVILSVNGIEAYSHDFSNNCSGSITPIGPVDLNDKLKEYRGNFVTLTISYWDKCGGYERASNFYLVFK